MIIFEFGETIKEEPILSEPQEKLYFALKKNRDFEFVEFQKNKKGTIAIVADIVSERIPNRNRYGIKSRERVAIVHIKNDKNYNPFYVFPLREDFPDLLHLNDYGKDIPRSLCLYSDPWSDIEREITSEKLLLRIVDWFVKSSNGELHDNSQPLEQLYFSSDYDLILPKNFEKKISDSNNTLYIERVFENPDSKKVTVEVEFGNNTYYESVFKRNYLYVKTPPVLHTGVTSFPRLLGDLQSRYVSKGSELIHNIKEEIGRIAGDAGLLNERGNGYTLLIINTPRIDTEGNLSERTDTWAFLLTCTLVDLGESLGILHKSDNRFYREYTINGNKPALEKEDWKDFPIEPIHVSESLTPEFAQNLSNVDPLSATFKGALLGAGSLGGSLADLWAKNGWGSWLVVDDDSIKVHNIVRHLAIHNDIGASKATIIANRMNSNFDFGFQHHQALYCNIFLENRNEWLNKLKEKDLLVDATATNHLVKDLSYIEDIPRSASVFLSPSGNGSVLLFEDVHRKFRLDYLEMLYYRALINQDWGSGYVKSTKNNLRVGVRCSDISGIISYEQVRLHASILSQQIRKQRNRTESFISLWRYEEEDGRINSHTVEISNPVYKELGNWKLLLDDWIISKLSRAREERLPKETGGILFGYFDQKLKKIYIIDVSMEPSDSQSSHTGFTRGTQGLKYSLQEIRDRTNDVVHYIGEWHSHPKNVTAMPSSTDILSALEFAEIMSKEGLPHVTVIVGESELSFSLSSEN